MNQVPIVHATEMLTHAFGVLVASLRRLPREAGDAMTRFDVTDDAGRQWRLEAAPDRRRPDPSWAPCAIRWGRHWVLSEVSPQLGDGDVGQPELHKPAPGSAATPPGWECADGRALERVGSWLAQPAGLPTATDILGQAFVDTWLRNRQHIATMHARAEALHDALGRHASAPGQEAAAGSISMPVCNEAYRHQRVLRHLVDSQQLLLGRQAAAHPVALRRDALRRLDGLLDAERARLAQGDIFSRAGAG